MPFAHTPDLPVTGQPAITVAYWYPGTADIGQWQFTYHLIDNVGQTFEYEVQVNVEYAVLVLGVMPTYAPLADRRRTSFSSIRR